MCNYTTIIYICGHRSRILEISPQCCHADAEGNGTGCRELDGGHFEPKPMHKAKPIRATSAAVATAYQRLQGFARHQIVPSGTRQGPRREVKERRRLLKRVLQPRSRRWCMDR